MLILYCTENVLLFLLYLIIFLPNYYKKLHVFFVNCMGGLYASELKASQYGSLGRNTFKLFYVYVRLKNCMFFIFTF